jgi:N-acetylglucosaminyldiphosphoundecaprenol N-acetyl-beta-D-mannosaminyltransferase
MSAEIFELETSGIQRWNTAERHTLLGVDVDKFDTDLFHKSISKLLASNSKAILLHHNMHSIYLYHRDTIVRDLYKNADGIWIDGMPIVYWGKVLGRSLKRRNRFTMSQWMPDFMERARDEGWRIFYIGSEPGVVETGISRFKEQFPGLQVDCQHGFFNMTPDGPENLAVLAKINNFRPHIVLVGMGMPRQEYWISQNHHRLNANVIANVGAAINYFADALQRPPAALSRLGLEWLYRLMCEPKRLSRRYLVEPWFLLPIMAGDVKRTLSR